MLRAGQCPSCNEPFDTTDHTPMVSVVCGHSLCKHCATRPITTGVSDTDSTTSDDAAVDDSTATCPVCHKALEGFVTNFEALAALQSSSQLETSSSPHLLSAVPQPNEPDLTAVVTEDLVISRPLISFVRAPSNELGRGGSAVVYKGTYNNLPVAIKCIRTMSDSFATEDRLRRELRNASRLKNPHIVEFRGAAWDFEDGPKSPRNVLLVTELMAGGNLRESLNSFPDENGLAVDSFVHIALQIARGIEYLHAEGLAHRDIKSANILLTQSIPKCSNRFPVSTRAKIADFGLSKYIDKATGGGTVMQSIMEPGRLEATYAYLAPEAFGGDKSNVIRPSHCNDDEDVRYDNMAKKRDIYALGVLFWEMLAGVVPWAGVSLPDVYVRVCVRGDRPAPALDDKTVDRTFHRLIDRCWAQNPSRRPSARSIVAKLEKLAVKYPLADATAAAAVESVSVVSGQTSIPNPPVTRAQDPVDSQKENGNLGEAQFPSESLVSYQKMPTASTVHTVQCGDSKTHSAAPAANEGGLDPASDHNPLHHDATTWVDDAVGNGRTGPLQSASSGNLVSGPTSVGNTNAQEQYNQLTRPFPANMPETTTPHRKSTRSKNVDNDLKDDSNVRASLHGGPIHYQHSGSSNSTGATTSQSKTSATAVAATAAAIAAAKDRERKRDDLRQGRVATSTSASARLARGSVFVSSSGVQNSAASGATDSSFQSLTGVSDNWTRTGAKDQLERPIAYANSENEAQEFDTDRAAAEEGASGASKVLSAQTTSRTSVSGNRPFAQISQQQSLLSRVTGRPKSPVARRPMSPSYTRQFSPSGGQGRLSGEEDLKVSQSLVRSTEVLNSTSSGPKRSASSSRGRLGSLGRTLSASASGVNGTKNPGGTSGSKSGQNHAVGNGNSSGFVGSVSGTVGSATMPVPTSPPMHTNGHASGSGNSLVPSSSASTDGTGRRAFIRRLRSNESAKRIVKSPSSTGVENRRGKDVSVVGSESGTGLGSNLRPPSMKSRSLHVADSGQSEDDMERDSDIFGPQGFSIGAKTSSLIGAPAIIVGNSPSSGGAILARDNFISIVDSMEKTELLKALTQRMQPLRLAAMALAALLSVRHRNDEEVLRNCCAYLHRLTVPQGSSSSQSTASGQHHSSHPSGHQAAHQTSSGGHDVSAKEQVSIRKYLKSRQGVEALLQALHPPESRHPTTLCYGLLALGNLTAWDLEAHKQFRSSHGVVQVTQVMKVHSANIGVQEKGCYALACVGAAYPPKCKPIFEESGGLGVVIKALSQVQGAESNDAVTKQACAALGAMCSSCPSNALYAGRLGALGFLVTSFNRFRKASRGDNGGKRSEMRLVCKAFVDLLCDAENRKDAGANGGCIMMIQAMQIFRLDAEFVEKVLVTLTQFCVIRSNGMKILAANGEEDIVGAMGRFKMAEVMQKEGCRLLTALIRITGDEARRKVVAAGGADAMVFALERFGAVPEAGEEVVIEACRALSAVFAMDNMAEGELLWRRMRKIRCDKVIQGTIKTHKQDSDIQQAGRDALNHLSSLRGSGLWSRMRNGSKKW